MLEESLGKTWKDRQAQLAFSVYELHTTEKVALKHLKAAATLRAATGAAAGIERPKGFSWAHPERCDAFDKRLAKAEALYAKFATK